MLPLHARPTSEATFESPRAGQPREPPALPGLDHLAQLPVVSLDRIGGIDQAADLFGELEEGGQLIPIVLPGVAS